jgi:peptidoglycan/LPS O-acetylase OafA/YrhL
MTLLAIGAYGILPPLLTMKAMSYEVFWSLFLILPALLALGLGALNQSRRRGAAAGAAVGLTVIVSWATTYSYAFGWDYFPDVSPGSAVLIGAGALVGAAGAQGRRILPGLRSALRRT